jgi:hypothetical protein
MKEVSREELRNNPAKIIRESYYEPIRIVGEDGTVIIVSCPQVTEDGEVISIRQRPNEKD